MHDLRNENKTWRIEVPENIEELFKADPFETGVIIVIFQVDITGHLDINNLTLLGLIQIVEGVLKFVFIGLVSEKWDYFVDMCDNRPQVVALQIHKSALVVVLMEQVQETGQFELVDQMVELD